jgi:hypothetical protein
MHGLDTGGLRTLYERFKWQRIEFSDKTHKTQGNKLMGKVERRAGVAPASI